MFTVVRKYRVRRGSGVEWTKRVQDSFVPLMRELKGFRGYYLIDGGPDVIITVSMFESADEALVSNEKAADWVRNNVLEFARGMGVSREWGYDDTEGTVGRVDSRPGERGCDGCCG